MPGCWNSYHDSISSSSNKPLHSSTSFGAISYRWNSRKICFIRETVKGKTKCWQLAYFQSVGCWDVLILDVIGVTELAFKVHHTLLQTGRLHLYSSRLTVSAVQSCHSGWCTSFSEKKMVEASPEVDLTLPHTHFSQPYKGKAEPFKWLQFIDADLLWWYRAKTC